MTVSTMNWLGRLLRLPLKLVPPGKTMRIVSGPLSGNRWISTAATHGCWLGTYEKDLQRALLSTLKHGQVFYDVGANVGFFTLLAAQRVGPTGWVVAFEPLPRNLELLRTHLDINQVANVTVIPAAVADTAGKATFSNNESASMGRIGAPTGIEVTLVSLDELLAAGEIPPPQVIKMDIEGAESLALAGASRLMREHKPVLFLSTHGWKQQNLCCEMLEGMGYTVRTRRDGSSDGQYEVVASM